MTRTAFATLSPSMFATVAASRRRLVAARKAVDAIEEACECARGCQCHLAPMLAAAKMAEREAIADNTERELAWRAYHEAR